jgi:predicted SPOUT superfamily RNA methylase MTH1
MSESAEASFKRKKSQKSSKKKRAKIDQEDKTSAIPQVDVIEEVPSESHEELDVTSSSVGVNYTVSVALPGSICANAQSMELRTYLAGQIARAVCIFNIDEVIIYDENAAPLPTDEEFRGATRKSNPSVFLARVLQYLETPQYLRKALFPIHQDLKYAGLLNPLDAPHHVRETEDVPFREGVVVNRPAKVGSVGSWVNVGLKKDALIDQSLQPGVRVTVQVTDPKGSTSIERKLLKGTAVAPSLPRTSAGLYWGYQTRLAAGMQSVWDECPFVGGYDLTIGISERGRNIHTSENRLPKFRHLLLVFGGLRGLEDSLSADQSLRSSDPAELFSLHLNPCPKQGSRMLRTEELIPIALAALQGQILSNN